MYSLKVGKLRGARAEVWGRVTSILTADCKKALGAVKTAVVRGQSSSSFGCYSRVISLTEHTDKMLLFNTR